MVVPTSLIILVGCSVAYNTTFIISLTTQACCMDTNLSTKKKDQIISEIRKILHWLKGKQNLSKRQQNKNYGFQIYKKKLQKILILNWRDKKINTKTHSKYLGVILYEIPSVYADLNIIKYKSSNWANWILTKLWQVVY